MNPLNPLIVQADRSVFLEAFNPLAEEARAAIAPFAELVSSPEHMHTYRVTPLSLWNAASAGLTAERMLEDWEPPPELVAAVVSFGDYIRTEVQALRLDVVADLTGGTTLEFDDQTVQAKLEVVSI